MTKFQKGDRVRVVAVEEDDYCDVGQVGTVLEDSHCPWVEFDTPTRYGPPVLGGSLIGYKGSVRDEVGRAGYCDCCEEAQLEAV